MVAALNQAGLRVVMDVVYNHTFAGGQDPRSVLDRVVPGYYHRLNNDGEIATSTCCANTASEHFMMEKLMIDSLLVWAKAYKIDGFRLDLMGHHMVSNLRHIRAALDKLTVERDGVDGSQMYLYGEGWDFGEVANGARGLNASQSNLGGMGVGLFNDRLRNGVRGGAPFSGLLEQGLITGLYWEPNGVEARSPEQQRSHLLYITDWILAGLAGNLKTFSLENAQGQIVTGDQVDYHGGATAFCLQPQENVLYVSAHDNETLFDAIQLKTAAHVSIDDRVRMHNLGVSLVMLGQGVPFFLAGDDLLRSKSLDRNSYRSSDWFNTLDFTYQTNNWGVGLPPEENRPNWPIMAPLLANPALKAGAEHIRQARLHFLSMLMIRKSSPLFRLRTAEEVQKRLSFLNTGPGQIPGLIVMHLADRSDDRLDPRWNLITVLFNATPRWQTFEHPEQRGYPYELHPILTQSYDPLVRQALYSAREGTYKVPPRTTAVFVAPRY
jgi:pullulanase-type alpha-1,6-glucosidase